MNIQQILFLFVLLGIANCANRVNPIIKHAKNACNNKYIVTTSIPSSSSLLTSALTGTSSTSTSTGTSTAQTTTSVDTTISITGTASNTFTDPNFLTQINKTETTFTGTITADKDVQVFAFKGLTTLDTWLIKYDSTTDVVCKAGASLTSKITSISDVTSLTVSLTTTAQNLSASTAVATYIACTSPYNTDLKSPLPKTGTLSGSSPITYSIKLYQDANSTSSASSAISTLTTLQEQQQKIKQQTAILDLVKCYNDADKVGDIKGFMLF